MEVRATHSAVEVADALRLRERVFVAEQGVPRRADRDGRDAEAIHLVALDRDALVGTCRLVLDGRVARLGRMAVDPTARRRGVGTAILRAAEREARSAGASRITLHAQVPVRELYERTGFVAYGEPFVEEGIEHVAMAKDLA